MITFLLTLLLGTMLVGIPILLSIALIGFIGMAMLPEVVMPLFAQKMFAQLKKLGMTITYPDMSEARTKAADVQKEMAAKLKAEDLLQQILAQ